MSWGDWDGEPGRRADVALAIGDLLAVLVFFVSVVVLTLRVG